MNRFMTALCLLVGFATFGQKKVLQHEDVEQWKTIKNRAISPDGEYVAYDLAKDNSDSQLNLVTKGGQSLLTYDRASNGNFSYDSQFLAFTIEAWKDTVRDMRRRKVKKDDLPQDTVGLYNLTNKELIKFPHVKSYKLPQKWSGHIALYLEDFKKETPKDSTENKEKEKEKKKKKAKKVSKKNGFHLLVYNMETQARDTLKYVTDYSFAKKGTVLAYISTGMVEDSIIYVNLWDLEKGQKQRLYQAPKAKYSQLSLSEAGDQLAFVVDTDTTKTQIRPNQLFYWNNKKSEASLILDNTSSPDGFLVAAGEKLQFSEDGSKLYFGLRKPPILKDTSLLKEEIVNVEVWSYNQPRLYTVQEMQVKNDTAKAYQALYDTQKGKVIPLATTEYPDIQLTDKGNAPYALLDTEMPYMLESQWTGRRLKDYAVVNTTNGQLTPILKATPDADLSPAGKYAFGYHSIDSTWYTYNIESKKYLPLTQGQTFYDEQNDTPNYPRSYGSAGWTKDDKALLLYDRYDIWRFDPNSGKAERLTQGRESKKVYRYIHLDREERYLDPKGPWLLSTFNEDTKEAGFAHLNPKNSKLTVLEEGRYAYGRPTKSELGNTLLYTRESFTEFPDLRTANLDFGNGTKISNANPQQSEYNWGTIEQVEWVSLDGIPLRGMLVKPENFDPNKKYPMIVNFYERSSDRLYRHYTPEYVRSTINYSFYASRGYVIFNPDVVYREGYPGESAFNCVMPGISKLIAKGFVDEANIGVQGHSWGGYQIAYLVTKTDLFKAAEAGAPVPNMISAYGGIRWWTGLSRQFQYEHTQSRIGGTPWEYPARYIENSPIFNLDKVNTPVLVLHNDKDGHVPWYQGIELFVSLRRLGKPSWLLNYNGEPHWPLEYQNRKDFSIRLAQYFDHYLQGAPIPRWMAEGVPAVEKGIKQGYEAVGE